MIGLDEAFEEFRRAMQRVRQSTNEPDRDDEDDEPAPEPAKGSFHRVSRLGATNRLRIVDSAIESLSQASGTRPAMHENAHEPWDGTAKPRFEPVCLTLCALVGVRRGGLTPASARHPRLFRGRSGIPGGRRKGVRGPGAG
jgi:hypothetical protein